MKNSTKHPKGLMVLFFTEMWERFSYYGMRGFLVLYLSAELITGGFGLDEDSALRIYATFLGLVYLTPIIGGFFADRYLGQRKAVFVGAFLMAIGHFSMALSEFGEIATREIFRNNGLGLIIMGTGFFKANISTIVGALYEENDVRKDSAFTIFYMGINLGALLGPLVAGSLGEKIDWFWGFTAAGIGMIISTLWFTLQRDKLGLAGMPPGRKPNPGENYFHLNYRDRLDILLYVIANVAFVWGLLKFWGSITENAQNIITWAIIIIGVSLIVFLVVKHTKGTAAWSKLSVVFILAVFNIFFWSGYEQAGGTFNLFAENSTNRMIGSYEVAASNFQSVPAFYIVAFGSLFAALWLWLNARGKEPRTPVKFGLGLILMSLGFVIMNFAANLAGNDKLVSPVWLLMVYFMHTMGELCLSPIGLSAVTKLSPNKIVSLMMGIWFGSIAAGGYLAGILNSLLKTYLPNTPLYLFLIISTFSTGVLALLLSPLLNKMMKDVH